MEDDSPLKKLRPGPYFGNASLTEEDVQEIRYMWGTREHTQSEIASMFSISVTQCKRICSRFVWKHVPDLPETQPRPVRKWVRKIQSEENSHEQD